jgi:hypothetical protein
VDSMKALRKECERLLTKNLSSKQLKGWIAFFGCRYRETHERQPLEDDICDVCNAGLCCIGTLIAIHACVANAPGIACLGLGCCLTAIAVGDAPIRRDAVAISQELDDLIKKCLGLLSQQENFSASQLSMDLQQRGLIDPSGLRRVERIAQDYSKFH